MLKTTSLIIAATCICIFASPTQAVFYDLGPGSVFPTGLTPDGSVAAGYAGSSYFRWTAAGGKVDIGGTTPGGGVGGDAEVSDDGRYISGTSFNPGSGFNEMSRYDHQTGLWTPLGGIGGSNGSEISGGWGISGDGTSIVGLGWRNPPPGASAIQWTETGGTVELASGSSSSRANAVNQDGSVVAGWQDGPGRQGAVWVNGVQTVIFSPDNIPVGEAGAVSADGNWVVGGGLNASGRQPWLWDRATSTTTMLGTIAPGVLPFASGVTDDGSTVIGAFQSGPPVGSGTGFIWRNGVLQELTSYVESVGVPIPDNFMMNLPLAISGDGKTISGLGRNSVTFAASGFVVSLRSNGDFDNDGDFACADVDSLMAEIMAGTDRGYFDLTDDGVVDDLDLTAWLAAAGAAENPSGNPYLFGDANLNGTVDGIDFIAWNMNKFASAGWCGGDFNADGFADGSDFILWNMNKFTSADGFTAVPEPTAGLALASICLLGAVWRRW